MPTKVRNPPSVRARRATNYEAVHRPTRWGNPFLVTASCPREQSMRRYARWLDAQLARDPGSLEPLRGCHLGCFCAPDEACHADLLLQRLYARA